MKSVIDDYEYLKKRIEDLQKGEVEGVDIEEGKKDVGEDLPRYYGGYYGSSGTNSSSYVASIQAKKDALGEHPIGHECNQYDHKVVACYQCECTYFEAEGECPNCHMPQGII